MVIFEHQKYNNNNINKSNNNINKSNNNNKCSSLKAMDNKLVLPELLYTDASKRERLNASAAAAGSPTKLALQGSRPDPDRPRTRTLTWDSWISASGGLRPIRHVHGRSGIVCKWKLNQLLFHEWSLANVINAL